MKTFLPRLLLLLTVILPSTLVGDSSVEDRILLIKRQREAKIKVAMEPIDQVYRKALQDLFDSYSKVGRSKEAEAVAKEISQAAPFSISGSDLEKVLLNTQWKCEQEKQGSLLLLPNHKVKDKDFPWSAVGCHIVWGSTHHVGTFAPDMKSFVSVNAKGKKTTWSRVK